MSDSALHILLAGVFLIAGCLLALPCSSIAAWIRHARLVDANRELCVHVTRGIPKGWARKAERLYERASMGKSLRWFGFILLGGALLQLWAAAIMKTSF